VHYRHSFHAGNFADVFKHAMLCALVTALNRKATPWCYLETHAGAGAYDLGSDEAAKTAEWQDGIGRLLADPPATGPLSAWFAMVRTFQAEAGAADGRLLYPGSPLLVRALARPTDRLVLCEKVPEVLADLREALAGDDRVTVHARDGFEAHALLPPKEKRGLTLVDPPFERPDEFEAAADFLKLALARFANGVYAAWYPLKNRFDAERFERRLARESGREGLTIHFDVDAPTSGRLRACGLAVINPPFGFDRDAAAIGAELVERLGHGRRAACRVQPLAAGATPRKNAPQP
jgi:23S rRNA (adenine2030-N6)-methyltransferase